VSEKNAGGINILIKEVTVMDLVVEEYYESGERKVSVTLRKVSIKEKRECENCPNCKIIKPNHWTLVDPGRAGLGAEKGGGMR